jgi:hypothetical protein
MDQGSMDIYGGWGQGAISLHACYVYFILSMDDYLSVSFLVQSWNKWIICFCLWKVPLFLHFYIFGYVFNQF